MSLAQSLSHSMWTLSKSLLQETVHPKYRPTIIFLKEHILLAIHVHY